MFPDELKVPLGHTAQMLDDAATVAVVDVNDDPRTQEKGNPQQEATDGSPVLVSILKGMQLESW